MAINMGTAIAYLELDTSKFQKGFKSAYNDLKVFGDKSAKTEQKMKGLSSAFKTTGSVLTKNVTTPLVGVGAVAVKTGSDFEKAMSQVAATMGTTTDKIQNLSKYAEKMGATTAFSATEAAEGLNILAMSGLNAEEQMSALPDVLNLASAGALSLDTAASYVTGTIKGFSDSMDNATYYTDLMAKGATLANTNVNGLGEALSQSAATASNYRQNAESATLSLLRLAEQNVTGAEAATALNRAMMDLYTPTDDARELLDELGISAYDASGNARDFNDIVDELNSALSVMSDEEANAYKNTIFTTYGLQAFNKMTVSSTEKVNEFKQGLADASGSAMQQAQTQLDNLQGDVTLFKSALEGAGIAISKTIIPMLRDFVQGITNLVTKFNELSPEVQDKIVKFGLLVASIGPLFLILSKVVSIIATVIKVFKTVGTVITTVKTSIDLVRVGYTGLATAMGGIPKIVAMVSTAFGGMLAPVLAVVAVIGTLVAVFVYLWNTSESFRNFWINLWETIKEVVSNAWDAIGTFFTQTIPNAFNTFVNETIPNFISKVVNWFEQLPYNIGYAVGQMIGHIYLFGQDCISWVTNELPVIIMGIIEWFATLPGRIWVWLSNVIVRIILWGLQLRAKAREVAKEFVTNFINFMKELPNKVWNIIKQIPQKVKEIGSQLKQAGKDIFNKLFNGIKSVGEDIIGWVSDFANSIKDFVSGIVDGFKSVVSGANDAKTAAKSVNGSHANGLDYVPYNGYVAELHEGERVLTKQQNKEYNEGKANSGGDTFNFYNTKPDPYEYARQMKKAKKELLYGI